MARGMTTNRYFLWMSIACICIVLSHEVCGINLSQPDPKTPVKTEQYNAHIHGSRKQQLQEQQRERQQHQHQHDQRDVVESDISEETPGQIMDAFIRNIGDILRSVSGLFLTSKTSRACANDLQRLFDGMFSGEKWAISFLDSSAKPGPSMTLGWLNLVGNMDQCQQAKAPRTKDAPGFSGHYCVFTLRMDNITSHCQVGLCYPSTCSETDVRLLLSDILDEFNWNVTVDRVECLHGNKDVTTATVCAIIVLSLIGGLMILGTFYDIVYIHNLVSVKCTSACNKKTLTSEKCQNETQSTVYQNQLDLATNGTTEDHKHPNAQNSLLIEIVSAFSVYSNGKKLLTIPEPPGSISCIHGIRCLSMAWVILCHIYMFGMDYSLNKSTEIPAIYKNWKYGIITNGFSSVDTFFVLSGLITSFSLLKEMEKKGWRINWPLVYVHRICRITFPYMFVLLVSLGLTKYLGFGPLWSNNQPFDKELCEKYWWRNLLYITNMWPFEDMCMDHSWYLTLDMQFFIISPLVIIPFHFSTVLGVAVCGLFLFASWTITGYLSILNNWPPYLLGLRATKEKYQQWLDEFYQKPWNRIGPFVIGIFAGYVLYRMRKTQIKLQWWVVALGWLVSTATALSVVYGLHGDISGQHPSSTGVAALYNSVARSAWGVSISWIILACDAGYGGPVNAILSWSPFVVLGRLNYMVYLLQNYVIYIYFKNLDMPFIFSKFTQLLYFIGFLVVCVCLAFVFVLSFESPFMRLEKIILSRKRFKHKTA